MLGCLCSFTRPGPGLGARAQAAPQPQAILVHWPIGLLALHAGLHPFQRAAPYLELPRSPAVSPGPESTAARVSRGRGTGTKPGPLISHRPMWHDGVVLAVWFERMSHHTAPALRMVARSCSRGCTQPLCSAPGPRGCTQPLCSTCACARDSPGCLLGCLCSFTRPGPGLGAMIEGGPLLRRLQGRGWGEQEPSPGHKFSIGP